VIDDPPKPMPARHELGDLDQSLWRINDKGEPLEPWKRVAQLRLVRVEDGTPLIFETDAPTAIDEVLKLVEKTGEEAPTTPRQISAWLEDVAGDQLGNWPRTAKTGELSTKSDQLKRLLLSKIPTVRPVLDILAKKKLLEAFGSSLHQHINPVTKRIHGNFHIGGSKAGRFSASEPNLQQLPSKRATEFKQAIVAAPGNLLVCGDWSQIELRAAAFISGDPVLTAMFAEGRDLHAEMAARITSVPLAEVTAEQRDAAKAVNFGSIYGISARSLAQNVYADYGVEMIEDEAQAALDTFFKT
jgi:DNA polymerase-1